MTPVIQNGDVCILTGNSWFTENNCKLRSLPRRGFSGLPVPLGKGEHADPFSVARVRPRTSKGITDLLLLNLVLLDAASPSKKNLDRTKDDPTI